ncbi:hypothetical protein GCM10027174_04890 [Salinifilum aidingensis]
MTETEETRRRRERHRAIRAAVAEEEAEAAAAEAAEAADQPLDVPLHVRISRELDEALRARARAEHVSPSALVRRLLAQQVHGGGAPVSAEDVEAIARRVVHEELDGST